MQKVGKEEGRTERRGRLRVRVCPAHSALSPLLSSLSCSGSALVCEEWADEESAASTRDESAVVPSNSILFCMQIFLIYMIELSLIEAKLSAFAGTVERGNPLQGGEHNT